MTGTLKRPATADIALIKHFTFPNDLSKTSDSTVIDAYVNGYFARAACAASNWYKGAVTLCQVYDFRYVKLEWENYTTNPSDANTASVVVFYTKN